MVSGSVTAADSRHWLWRGRWLLQAPGLVPPALAAIPNHQPHPESSVMPRRRPGAHGKSTRRRQEMPRSPWSLVSHCPLGSLSSGSAPPKTALPCAIPSGVWGGRQSPECLKAARAAGFGRSGPQRGQSRLRPAALAGDARAVSEAALPTWTYSHTLAKCFMAALTAKTQLVNVVVFSTPNRGAFSSTLSGEKDLKGAPWHWPQPTLRLPPPTLGGLLPSSWCWCSPLLPELRLQVSVTTPLP